MIVMASEIPTHHIKQRICASRPPYREGKHAKAVKVYTVNNESCYILIQGVPSVGATNELSKLCSSFGPVEQFSPLDDYPCEDKFTEVYLVKYQKIQSARFAKRKLDDFSFFGGVLHICYAPEYESVNETREKLQDRRRVVAAKIRQHAADLRPKQTLDSRPRQIRTQLITPQNGQSAPPSQQSQQQQLYLSSSTETDSSSHLLAQESQVTNLRDCEETVTGIQTFQLPLPPKALHPRHKSFPVPGDKYEFARVPSSHATLAPGWDGRLHTDRLDLQTDGDPTLRSPRENLVPLTGRSQTPTKVGRLPDTHPTSGLVVKDYKPPKVAAPRFVPRQALVKTSRDLPVQPDKKRIALSDTLSEEIKKNAFSLGQTQGPSELHARKRPMSSPGQQSVTETIHAIRSKISKVIVENVHQTKEAQPAMD